MKILHFRRRLSGVLAMLCFVATLSAQRHMSTMNLPPDPVADQADKDYPHFFDYFNQITTTGLLQDRSSLRVKLRHFSQNLLTDETAFTREDYGYLYASLRVAATSPSLEPPPAETTYMAKMQLRYPGTMVKLFGIAYRYDYVREDAITLGLAHLTQHQLVPDTDPATLLRIDTVFAIAPQVHRIDSSAAYLLFPDMVKNLSLSISQIEVNANEGLGWQVIPAGRGVWINFSTPGIHDITVRTSDGNGWWLLSHFKLFTDFNNTNSMFEKEFKIRDRISYDPDNPRIVDITSEEVYEGQNSKVKLFILGKCEDNLLRKPLIIVDGFEPRVNGNSIDLANVFYDDKLGSIDHPLNDGIPKNEQIRAHQALFDAGYDLVFVDWADWEIFDHVEEVGHLDGDRWIHDYDIAVYKTVRRGGQDYIQRNAKAIETALKLINNEKATITHSGLSNQLIGMSMGGSVCKWALLDMEEKALAHDVENFYSYDSPLKGANITIGLQAMLFDLAGLKLGGKELKNEVPALQEGIDVLTSPFAKQTLLAQADGSDEFALFDQIQDEYAKKGKNRNGDFVDVNYRCISNGSLSNIHQINIEPGGLIGSLWTDIKSELDKNTIQSEKTKDWIKEVHYVLHSVLSAIWWQYLDADIWAMNLSGNTKVYERRKKAKVFGITVSQPQLYTFIVANSTPLDVMAAGFTALGTGVDASIGFRVESTPFIPVGSSLDIRDDLIPKLNVPYDDKNYWLGNNHVRCINYVGNENQEISSFDYHLNDQGSLEQRFFLPQPNQVHVFTHRLLYAFLFHELLKDNNSVLIDGLLDNIKYNFGNQSDDPNNTVGQFQPKMSNYISNNLELKNNSELMINKAGEIGLIDGDGLPSNSVGTKLNVYMSGTGCSPKPVTVTLNTSTKFLIGDNVINNRGNLIIGPGCKLLMKRGSELRLENFSTIVIGPGATLELEDGSKLSLNNQSKIIISKDGRFKAGNDINYSFQNGSIIEINGYADIGRTNIKNMDGFIDLKEGGQWYVHGDLTLKGIDRAKTILKNVHGAINYFDNVNLDISNGTILSEVGGGTGFSFNSGAGNVTFNNVVFKYGMPLYISGLNGVFKATDCDYNDVNRSATIASANDNSKTYKVLIDKCKVYNTSISNAGFVINGIKWVKATGSQFYTNRNRWSNINQGGIGFSLIDVGNISLENCHFAKLNSAISNNSANIDMNCTYMINCVYGVNNIYISPISHVLKMRQSGMIGNRVGGQLENAILDISTPSYEWFLGNIFSDCCYPTQNLTFIPPQFHKAIESGFRSGEEGQQIPDDVPGDRLPACGYIFKGTVSNQLLPPEYLIPASYNYWFDNALNCMSKVSNLTHFISGRWTDLDTDPSNTFGDMRDIMSCTEIMMDRKTDPASLKTKKTGENAVINIFPNPGTNVMKIEASDIAKSFELYDLSGRRVTNGEISQYTEINLSELTSGVYYILIRDAENDLIFKQKYVVIR